MTVRTDFQDGLARCAWVDDSTGYQRYHDDEWGRPVADDRSLFEQLCLEGFQSGLSWRTILDKRDGFRRAFADFDIDKVARYTPARVDKLVLDAGIVRHRGKIEAVINNAQRAREMRGQHGSLGAFFWRYEAQAGKRPAQPVSVSEQSQALSKDLKKLGWKFVGPTTVYAFMQSVGMVNDHHPACHHHAACETARARFVRPA
ncbi:DNA-3-methyladenine glycosylase I [Bordetella petrii]|uniref:DNA-3-methyladenine glycosylase I n=1 Tax=Bordetella petrii TaxID=94624 RepID=UPI001E5A2C18|nr:DNA-3-methyladenine glycosylase I [Bordetella petrii]MCD0503546.1 DNA-3-methyladenine glycosylase I [Bordetella petrii]